MTRKEWCTLCQEVARYPTGINRARDLPERLIVVFDGIRYYPEAYQLRFMDGTGEPYEVGIMHDLKANSVTGAELKNIRRAIDETGTDL